MGVRMLQSHICVSPRLPPSPPPLPSLMPKEEIVPGKTRCARGAGPPEPPRGPGGPHWEVAPPRKAGGSTGAGRGDPQPPVTRHGAQGGC